jgi:hypothetical protein
MTGGVRRLWVKLLAPKLIAPPRGQLSAIRQRQYGRSRQIF